MTDRQIDIPTLRALVSAKGLSDRYGRRVVFESLDLQFGNADSGEGITGLLGPNGAGKTTLLQLMCGIRRPSAGSLSVMNVDVGGRSASRQLAARVGYLPQTFGYLPSYSVRDFVTYAAWLKKMASHGLAAAVDAAIEDVGLTARAGSKMRTLSGGMIRRVGIAAAIVHQPRLLLLDEPATGLDPAQRADLRSLLVRLSRDTCVIMSTHLIDDVRAVCSEVVVIGDGTIRFAGTPQELESAAGPGRTDLEAGYLPVLCRPREVLRG